MVEAIDYRDYIRGRFRDFDIMAFSGKGVCFSVEYVDIRGSTAGKGTTLPFFRVRTMSFFTRTVLLPAVSLSLMSAVLLPVKTTLACTVMLM